MTKDKIKFVHLVLVLFLPEALFSKGFKTNNLINRGKKNKCFERMRLN